MSKYKAIPAYYDAEYAYSEMLEHDVPFMLAHMPGRRQRVLELAVGTGRAAVGLAAAGHRVMGVDYDAGMLAIAKRKRDAAGILPRDLELVRGDLLRLKLGERFDWICLLFNTFLNFTSLEAQDAVLRGVVGHLKPRGRFWLDIFQPNLALLAQESSTDLDPFVFHVPALGRTVFKVTDIKRDPSVQVQRVTFRYVWFDDQGREQRERTEFDLTFIFPRELRLLLERNGLKIERMYGDYDGSCAGCGLAADHRAMCAGLRREEGGEFGGDELLDFRAEMGAVVAELAPGGLVMVVDDFFAKRVGEGIKV